MKRIGSRDIGSLLIFVGVVFVIALLIYLSGFFKLNKRIPETTTKNKHTLNITYPQNNTLFPPEISSPAFKWNVNFNGANNWLIQLSVSGNVITSEYVFEPKWKPDSLVWEKIKTLAKFEKIGFVVACRDESGDKIYTLSDSILFQFSTDSVKAPLFFRQVDLPFKFTSEHLSSIEWCLGDISNYKRAKTLLTGINICGNCHSFSSKGKFMGTDFDYHQDKGGYATINISKDTRIEGANLYSWNQLSSKGNSSSGFLSSVSPDGRYVISTINDHVISFFEKNEFRFFPIKGVLAIYDRLTGESYQLPGANDSKFVQCNATWSPNGETIVFAKAYVLSESELSNADTIKELTSGNKAFRFDLWSIPFNNGKGGIAKAVAGASSNGKSNYFPRISPDGKWIVFTQSHSYMLRQLDSRLVIIPFGGGEPRELECNMASSMNSWHTWSPNSKWIAFSTKGFSQNTKIALTHINEMGHASPPVLLENFINDSKAANIPEFVNIDYDNWNSIKLDFLNPVTISPIDLRKVRNGCYQGMAILNGAKLELVSATLKIVVVKGKVVEINIIESMGIPETAKEILKRVIQLQTIDIWQLDANTTEELVVIKAIEDGLNKGHSQ